MNTFPPEVTGKKFAPEVTELATKLSTIDLPNVYISGSYALGRAIPESDVDILVGLTDAEWGKVTPQSPPEILSRVFQIVPEEKLDIKLYRLSDKKDMWLYRRSRVTPTGKGISKGISGAFVSVGQMKQNPELLIQNLWENAVEPKALEVAIPKAEVTPVTPEVTKVMSVEEVSKLETRLPLKLLWKDEATYMDRLTTEIQEKGITEPVTIRVREDGSQIVWDGLHRLAIAQKLGIKDIPVQYIGEVGKLAIHKASGNPGFTAKEASRKMEYKVDDIKVTLKYERPGVHLVIIEPPGGRPITEEEGKKITKLIEEKTTESGGDKKILERLGRGQTVNNLLPMSPEEGPPLPRALKIHWPWKK